MPSYAKKFDNASSNLFFAGFVISQLRYAPFIIATTIIVFLPIATLIVTLTASACSICLGAAAFRYWAECVFFDYPPDAETGSYTILCASNLISGEEITTYPEIQPINALNFSHPLAVLPTANISGTAAHSCSVDYNSFSRMPP